MGKQEYARIIPRCCKCDEAKAAEELTWIGGKRYCVPCADKTLPGGVKAIWSMPL